jgi:L-lactate dehydrogenase
MNKVVIVGCGNVGMAYAYSLVNQKSKVEELVLIDINADKAEGEALDLNHALVLAPNKMIIKSGNYSDCNGASIIVICAGKNQEVGETRLDLINKNFGVFKNIINEIKKTNFDGIFLIATNPVDIMTYVTYKLSGFDSKKVIGSGTSLDTSRLRYLIGKKLDINPQNVHSYVIGEHGDSEMIPWSKGVIGINDISSYLNNNDKQKILDEVRNSAYEIIKKKGNTSYGIGICLSNITNAILDNDNSIITVSCYHQEYDLYISLPAILNKNGLKEIVSLNLSSDESKEFMHSIATIQNVIKGLKF